ncbi:MAG: hypothetical protein U9N59_16740 [Campylobacterota bacterium]|nr:hypothetical protein [Campylobacterota bacterium]
MSIFKNFEEILMSLMFVISAATFFVNEFYIMSSLMFIFGSLMFYYNSIEKKNDIMGALFQSKEIDDEDLPETIKKFERKLDTLHNNKASKTVKLFLEIILFALILLIFYLTIEMTYSIIEIFKI